MNSTYRITPCVAALGLVTFTIMTSRPAAAQLSDASSNVPPSSLNSSAMSNASPPVLYNPFTIGVEAGTIGAGVEANWRFSDHFGVGTAFDYFSYSYRRKIEDGQYDVHLRLMSEPLTLNWYPWKNHSFRVGAGLVFNENHLTGTATSITLNGSTYSQGSLSIKQQVLDPYLAIGGNLYFDRRRHVSLGGKLGVFYTGDPRVSLSVPGAPASDVQTAQDKIKSYARYAQFWPVINISLNYSF